MRVLSLVFAVFTVACGGPSDSPPTPLSQRFDEMHVAAIPLDQKQAIVQANNDWQVAKFENAKAEADLNEITSQLSVVRNDQKSARLSLDSAVSNKKSAEASSDTNRINAAQKELRAAELQVKAADARIKYYEAYRGYLKRLHRYTQENMYWREAQYELAKSQLAQRSNIAPKNISFDAFPRQESERNKRAQSARDKAESEKRNAQSARESWLRQQQVADQESGRPSTHPDPMLPKVQSTTGSI